MISAYDLANQEARLLSIDRITLVESASKAKDDLLARSVVEMRDVVTKLFESDIQLYYEATELWVHLLEAWSIKSGATEEKAFTD